LKYPVVSLPFAFNNKITATMMAGRGDMKLHMWQETCIPQIHNSDFVRSEGKLHTWSVWSGTWEILQGKASILIPHCKLPILHGFQNNIWAPVCLDSLSISRKRTHSRDFDEIW
jgi:hypothetical protein